MDKFSDIFKVTLKPGKTNPLNIVVDHPQFGGVRLPDMSKSFEDDISGLWHSIERRKGAVRRDDVIDLITYYFFDLLFEFKTKANGILPAQIVDDVFEQVLQAYKNLSTSDTENTIHFIRRNISNLFYDETIYAQTQRFMSQFRR